MDWNKVKTAFEKQLLCPSLSGRVRFEFKEHEFNDNPDDDAEPQYSILSIFLDDRPFFEFNSKDYYNKGFSRINARLRHTIQEILSRDYLCRSSSFEASFDVINDFIPWLTSKNGVMNADHAIRIMERYTESSFDETKEIDNCFVTMLNLLDKRLSDDELAEYACLVDTYEPEWLRKFIKLRLDADKLN